MRSRAYGRAALAVAFILAATLSAAQQPHDLSIDEAMGGHTLARHVGRTDAQLAERLRIEKQISAASTYTDRAAAERSVGAALADGGTKLSNWQRRVGRRPNLVLYYAEPSRKAIGRSLSAAGPVRCPARAPSSYCAGTTSGTNPTSSPLIPRLTDDTRSRLPRTAAVLRGLHARGLHAHGTARRRERCAPTKRTPTNRNGDGCAPTPQSCSPQSKRQLSLTPGRCWRRWAPDGRRDARRAEDMADHRVCRRSRLRRQNSGSSMPLSTGSLLGPYQILEAIGAGGMGEVYRARDTNSNREVALKVLPDLFAPIPSGWRACSARPSPSRP